MLKVKIYSENDPTYTVVLKVVAKISGGRRLDITMVEEHMGNKRTARSVFGKLILAASTYFIWLERNNRVFKKVKKSPEDIRDMVKVTVRSKLLYFRFKMTNLVELLLSRWKMPTSFRIYGDV
ncbi:hypothetical protein Tco_0622373 [Tanacetum coccineum]